MFHSLSRADLVQVVDIQLRHVTALLAERGYRLVISPEARTYLAEVGYDADYGARPLKRAIQRELQDPLAVKILGGEFHEGETIHVERGKEKLQFTAQATAQPVAP
jgi:ATP-dependent Clp protease ATP-binding subunit ClpB